MQRTYLLSTDFKITSITEYATQFKINPLYTILNSLEIFTTSFSAVGIPMMITSIHIFTN